jgi:hypothetical protein
VLLLTADVLDQKGILGESEDAMPAWVDTPAEEAAWQKAKGIVARQRKKQEADFGDRDWGLVTHIAKNLLKSSTVSGYYKDEGMVYALSNVERILDTRRKRERKDRDRTLSASDQNLVSALSQVAALGGQSIAVVRGNQQSKLSTKESVELAVELQAVASRLKDLLLKVRG